MNFLAVETYSFMRCDPSPAPPKPPLERTMRDLVPGGYLFIHLVFWTVVSMVAVGTQLMAIVLSVGLGLLAMESLKR